jgi:hypothetical protein
MFDLCKYKDILGVPNQGIHSYRLFGVAIIDVIMTMILAYVISILTKIKYIYSLLFCFLLGIIMHRLFCVKTTIDKLLFGSN